MHVICNLPISRRIGVRPLVVIRELIHLRSPALWHYCCMLQGSGSGEDDCTWLHNTILLLYAAVSVVCSMNMICRNGDDDVDSNEGGMDGT